MFTNVNDLIPLATFNKLYEKMKSLTSKYEKLIIEKDTLQVENERLKQDYAKQEENLKFTLSENSAQYKEISTLKEALENQKSEKEEISK